ncbi:hypothetical protein RND81_09G072000 [Saponaria officinalis]|uniref:Ubiquitin-like protease family profile domain-containing protein n=1 Tax=Saponaria officinalis TaxID=3572 RepID=A0AAW1IJS9_SAPOF
MGDDTTRNDQVMKYVENSLLKMKDVGVVLVPFCQAMHWTLIILCPLTQEAYFCDPMSKRRDVTFKYLLQGAFRGFKARAGYTLKGGMSLKWSNLICHQQTGSTECGYYVMRYMLDIVRHYHRNINDYKKWFGSQEAYRVEDVNEVRDLWGSYFMKNHL